MAAIISPFDAQGPRSTSNTKESEYFQQLKALVHPVPVLRAAGYVVAPLSSSDLERKKRCARCGVRCIQKERKRPRPKGTGRPERKDQSTPQATESPGDDKQNTFQLCKFHTGVVANKIWTCCGDHVSVAKPCAGERDHQALQYRVGELEGRWQFHQTPAPGRGAQKKKLAVALDCEMGTASDGETELIRLTAIDYFTGEILINSLVYPNISMQHYNTRYSGVTRAEMEKARRQMRCLFGKHAARRALWRFVGPETIVVGHAAQNDLASLRWIHHSVVDSFLVEDKERKREELEAEERKRAEAEAEKKGEQESTPEEDRKKGELEKLSLSLKALALRKLGRQIQTKAGKGHDSLEDAVTSRDLIHRHIETLMVPMEPKA
ncbi:Exonuclease domain-containing protein [Madurella fahalii]|uniref:Exonuclease domain-containing protein n=1 Tax=Madurella fahalii TaxID=1157608 RepID=A0ABQ0GKF6_9PEZI